MRNHLAIIDAVAKRHHIGSGVAQMPRNGIDTARFRAGIFEHIHRVFMPAQNFQILSQNPRRLNLCVLTGVVKRQHLIHLMLPIMLFVHHVISSDRVQRRLHLRCDARYRNAVVADKRVNDSVLLEKFNQSLDFGDGYRMALDHLALITVVLTIDGDHHVNVFLFDQLINHTRKHAARATRGDSRDNAVLLELANGGVHTGRNIGFIFDIQGFVYIKKDQFDLLCIDVVRHK